MKNTHEGFIKQGPFRQVFRMILNCEKGKGNILKKLPLPWKCLLFKH